MPENETFGRDLGYLEKFFDKLEAHAGTLPSDAGQRLRALVSEERARWTEIRRLIDGGEAPSAESAPAPAPAPEKAEASAPHPLLETIHPYTRALRESQAQQARAAEASVLVTRTPDAGPSRGPGDGRGGAFTVGSLKRRRD